MSRNDNHSPSQIDPSNYTYWTSFDVELESGDLDTPSFYREMLTDTSIERPYAGELHRCDHCGASFKYGSIYGYGDKGGFIVVGWICSENTMSVPDRARLDQQRLRSAAATRRENARLEAERVENLEESTRLYPEAVELLSGYEGNNSFISDVAGRFSFNGRLSEKQAAAVVRSAAKDAEYAAKLQEQKNNAVAVVEGKAIKVIGEIISRYVKDTAYGSRSVMTVRDDRGFTVWGSVPSIEDRIEKGDRVEFVANIERSDSDETFGFFKRPRKTVKL